MPLKIEIFLDGGHGGHKLSGFWIVRMEALIESKTSYRYQVSEQIHPWKTLTEFTFERGQGHLLLVSKALVALDGEGYKAVFANESLGDPERINEFRTLRRDIGVTPSDYL